MKSEYQQVHSGSWMRGTRLLAVALLVVCALALCASCSGASTGASTEVPSTNPDRYSVYAVDLSKPKPSLEDQRTVLKSTIDAFMAKQDYTLFTTLMKDSSNTPEDATSRNNVYTTCGALIHSVYMQCFGIDLPTVSKDFFTYAEENLSGDEIPLCYRGVENVMTDGVLGEDEFDEAGFKHLFSNALEPGDIISILHRDGTGHVMVVYSVDPQADEILVAEAVGTGYQFANDIHHTVYQEDGPYCIVPAERKFNYYHTHDDITDIIAFRLLSEDCSFGSFDGKPFEYRMTGSADARLAYPGLRVEKTARISCEGKERAGQAFASPGDDITYTISVSNGGNKTYAQPIEVSETVHGAFEITASQGAKQDGQSLSWQIAALSPGQSTQVQYTVKVGKEAQLNAVYPSEGSVAGLPSSRIETRIVRSLGNAEKESVYKAFTELAGSSSTERDFINEIYSQALGIDMKLSNDLGNRDIVHYSSEKWPQQENGVSVMNTDFNPNVPSEVKSAVLGNCFGLPLAKKADEKKGYVGRSNWHTDLCDKLEANDRARNLASFTLNVDDEVDTYEVIFDDGDVLLTYSANAGTLPQRENQAYIFFRDSDHPGGALYHKASADEIEVLTGPEMTQHLMNLVGGDEYIVLRPAQLLGS